MKKNNLPIIDLFTSIQGEGQYAGVSSIFIRVSGCNLRCVFGHSICDTPYSSFNPEETKFTVDDVINEIKNHPNVHSIVVTGGEPMLYQDGLLEMFDTIRDSLENSETPFYQYHITIETNGTIEVKNDNLSEYVDLWSISPKLSTSVAKPNTEIEVLGDKKVFSEDQVNHYNTIRKNIPNLVTALIDSGSVQFKFVYSGEESYREIKEWRDEMQQLLDINLAEDGIRVNVNYYIMLMPEGMTEDILQLHRKEAAEICVNEGWRYTDRLHITIWGDKRGF